MRPTEILKSTLNFAPKLECVIQNQLILFEILADIRMILKGRPAEEPERMVKPTPQAETRGLRIRPEAGEAAFRKKVEEAKGIIEKLDNGPGRTDDYV